MQLQFDFENLTFEDIYGFSAANVNLHTCGPDDLNQPCDWEFTEQMLVWGRYPEKTFLTTTGQIRRGRQLDLATAGHFYLAEVRRRRSAEEQLAELKQRYEADMAKASATIYALEQRLARPGTREANPALPPPELETEKLLAVARALQPTDRLLVEYLYARRPRRPYLREQLLEVLKVATRNQVSTLNQVSQSLSRIRNLAQKMGLTRRSVIGERPHPEKGKYNQYWLQDDMRAAWSAYIYATASTEEDDGFDISDVPEAAQTA